MAEDLARSSGTPDEVIQKCLTQEFLTKCLRKAKFSADLLQDTLDACEINDLNALVLGSGLMTVTQASEKLFLMQDEANTVVKVCRKECLRAGVNFGDGAQLTAEELAENDDEEPSPPALVPAAPPAPAAPAPAPAHPAIQVPPTPSHPPANRFSPAAAQSGKPSSPGPAATSTPTPATATSASPAAQASAAKEPVSASATALEQRPSTTTPTPEHPDPNFLIKPPASASSIPPAPTTTTPASARSHIPKPSIATPATPAAAVATPRERPVGKPLTRASPQVASASPPTSSGGAQEAGNKSTATPSMNGKYTPSVSSSSAAKPPRPSTAPLTARSSTTAPLGKDRPSSALATPPLQQSTKLPSYAKPTASHKARLLKEESDVPSTSGPAPPITFASTNKPLRRLLYMPPRPTSSTPEEKKEPKKPIFDNIRSNLLRPTAAFLAWSSGKSRGLNNPDLRSSQSLQAEVTTKSLRGPNSAPPKGREFSATTMLTPTQTQAPLRLTTTPEPFRLASAERHQKAQEELQKKKEEKARLESQIPKFKASPMPSPALVAKTESKRDT